MSKYFKVEKEKEMYLSEYGESKEDIKYLIKVLGDVKMELPMIKLFCRELHSFGGRYDVIRKPETIRAMYYMTQKYPYLTDCAIDEVWFKYIKDLFDEYSLDSTLEDLLRVFGMQDVAFEQYLCYIEYKASDYQKKFEEEEFLADSLKEDYSESFIKHIKFLITRRHIMFEDIKKCIPSYELIEKDEEHIIDLSKRTRIFFGCCEPVSYTLVDSLVEDKTLDSYEEELKYYASTGMVEQATFTKQEFLDSIEKVKTKKK